ncbi:hypothetical protein [Streptomyces sp. BSE7-9]|nr:hypothetical protein [Streptomyces sp. BSE7-9]MBJ6644733.1 hypothetical protein [Streptomyces sp. BSE7-9]
MSRTSGSRADLLVIDGGSLEDLSALKAVRAVVAEGCLREPGGTSEQQ